VDYITAMLQISLTSINHTAHHILKSKRLSSGLEELELNKTRSLPGDGEEPTDWYGLYDALYELSKLMILSVPSKTAFQNIFSYLW
jgi:hypothetical protein